MFRHQLRQSRASLAIDEISITAQRIQQSQVGTNELLRKINDATTLHSLLLANALQDRAITSNVSQETPAISQNLASQELYGSYNKPSLKVRVHLAPQFSDHCGMDCRCCCHIHRTLKSPALLQPLVGRLFIGYYGNPTNVMSSCSIPTCESQPGFRGCVQYYFPLWFCSKVLEIATCASRAQEPIVSLTVRGVQPVNSEIWMRIWKDDDQAIHGILRSGLARPNDTQQQSGLSLLTVRRFLISTKSLSIMIEVGPLDDAIRIDKSCKCLQSR